MDMWTNFHGDEATSARTSGMNFRYSTQRSHNLNPASCAAPVTMGPLPSASGPSFDELFGFDLAANVQTGALKATNVKFDLNVDSSPTSPSSLRGIVVALIHKGTKTFVGYERAGVQGTGKPLGRVIYGSVSNDYSTLQGIAEVVNANPPVCVCGTTSLSCQPSYCPETVSAWHTYFSIEPQNATQISVSAFSDLWAVSSPVVVNLPNPVTGALRLGVYASSAESTHNLHGMWIQVRNEQYQIRSRVFSQIYTGSELSRWANTYLTSLQTPFPVPITRGPYVNPFLRNSLSSDITCYPDRWDFEVIPGVSTTVNQGTPPQWSGGVRSSSEQEFEQTWFFPVVPAASYTNENDILVQLHTVSDPTSPYPDNRVLVGITDASISATTAGRFFGFERASPQDNRLGWIVDGLQLTGTNGFRNYDEKLGDNVLQSPDELKRVNLFLTRGGSNTPAYLEIPYDDEKAANLQIEYGESGQIATSFSLRLIQSRNTFPPGQSYVFLQAQTTSHPAGTFLTQAFISGGSTIDTSGRRLDGSQVLAMNAFQFIGKTRGTQAESEYVTPPGQSSGFSMVAFALDYIQMSCMRREGEPEQWDLCEQCNGNNSCVDCMGVPGGTSKLDACGRCNGDNSTCKDCHGVPNGSGVPDACGVCDGNNSTCSDCHGIPHGTSKLDACNVCDGHNDTCADCAGVPHGTSKIDSCGKCDGDGTSCIDCEGVANGTAVIDACGVCKGDNSSCCVNYLGVYNYVWDWLLLRVSIDDLIVKLRNLYYMLQCENENLPWYDDARCDGQSNENAKQIASLQLGDMAATHTDWLLDCLNSFNEMVQQWTVQLEKATPN